MAHGRDLTADPFTSEFIQRKAGQICHTRGFDRSEFDDLCQEMLLAVWKQAGRFDPQRGSPEAFVMLVVDTWIRMEIRRRRRLKRGGCRRPVSIDAAASGREGASLGDLLAQADLLRRTGRPGPAELATIDLMDAFRHALHGLRAEDRRIVEFVALHGQRAAAREWSKRLKTTVSKAWVKATLERVRRRFEDSGLSRN